MRIAIASDHAGFIQKGPMIDYIQGLGHEVIDLGPELMIAAISRLRRSCSSYGGGRTGR